jgi:glycosyltransferase involved in cell wall biosynthesis
VFVSHSSLPNDQVIPYRQLYRVIKIADTIDHGWGVPDSLFDVIYNPVDPPAFEPYESKENPPYNILLVSRLNSDRIELVRDIISALNYLPDYRLHIVGGGLAYLLKSISNRNIVFEGQQVSVANYFKKADIVIGSGRTAVEGMSYSKPVIIAGLRGLGGLITVENYERFRNMMFSGRYKGKLNEGIPREGLITTILAAQKNSSLADIVHKNYHSVCKDFGLKKIASQFERVLIEVLKLHQQIHDDIKILNLKPVFNMNFEIFRNGDDNTFEIYHIESGQYLGYMDKRGRALVAKFDGEHSLEECSLLAGFKPGDDLSEFVRITREFWYQKLITF